MLESYFNDAKLGPKTDSEVKEKAVDEIDIVAFIKNAVIDFSRAKK